jgi:hypothetical protein
MRQNLQQGKTSNDVRRAELPNNAFEPDTVQRCALHGAAQRRR